MTAARIDIGRHFAPVPLRIGFVVAASGRQAGVVVWDDRPSLSGAACRCGAAVYDVALPAAGRWLADHLATVHGADRLAVDVRGAGRSPVAARAVEQLVSALTVHGRRAVA